MIYDVVIIGGGASGLKTGIEALKKQNKKTLIIESEDYLGGNLNLFIHHGFNNMTGPELATLLVRKYKDLGGEFKVKSTVLSLDKDRNITYISPNEGIQTISAKKVVIASGMQERFTGNINIPIHKFTGIFTIASAHKLINFKGVLPAKEVVIIGKNRWSLILARRFFIEGAKVKAILVDKNFGKSIKEEDFKIIEGFNIPVIKNCEIIELSGTTRVEEIVINNLDTNIEETIPCDGVIISVGYYPEIDFIQDKFEILENHNTNFEDVYICGTARLGEVVLETSYTDVPNIFLK